MASHVCHAVSCKTPCPPEWLMCPRHWRMVPAHLQQAVWSNYRKGQCDDKQVTIGWLAAADKAIEFVAVTERRPRALILAAMYLPAKTVCSLCGKQQYDTVHGGATCQNSHHGAPGVAPGAWEPPPPTVEETMGGEEWPDTEPEPPPSPPADDRPLCYNDRFWRIVRAIEQGCERDVEDNPYGVMYRSGPNADVDYDAFDYAVLRECEMAPNDPRRLAFIAWVVLEQSRRDGHTVVCTEEVVSAMKRRGLVELPHALQLVKGLVDEGVVRARRDLARVSYLALGSVDDCEDAVARFLASRIARPPPTDPTQSV